MAVFAERSGHRAPRFAVASVALFSMFFGSAEAQNNHEHNAVSPVIERLGSLAMAGLSDNHVAEPLGRHAKHPRHHRHHHMTPAQWAAKQVTPAEFRAWSKVNICEEGGNWHVRGSIYSGGLGISNVNWIHYGGRQFAPNGADATPDEQIIVAERIQPNPPDQHGCTGSW